MNHPYIIGGSSSSSPVVDNAGPDGVIITPTGSLYAPLLLGNDGRWTVTINGAVQAGIILDPDNNTVASTITVHSTGFVRGDVELKSAAVVKNAGSIVGETTIELFNEAPHTITNSGTIFGSVYSIASTAGASIDTVTNSGILTGNVALGEGDDHLFNTGRIFGDVDLGKGADVFKVSGKGIVTGVIDLGDGADAFFGGAGAETVKGGEGTDTIKLGGGNDTFKVVELSGGGDTINGGAGVDTYDASSAFAGVIINLDTVKHGLTLERAPNTAHLGTGGIDKIFGFENAKGGEGNDTIDGSAAGNVLDGGKGRDLLSGYGGNDSLFGGDGDGNDLLIGGLGRDALRGGAGADTFFFLTVADSGVKETTRDVIEDFSHTEADLIDLSVIDVVKGGTDDAFTFIGRNPFDNKAGQLRAQSIFDPNDSAKVIGALVEADMNGDAKADFSIFVKCNVALVKEDFNL